MASFATANVYGRLTLIYTVVIGGVVGYGLWFWLIARCSMSRVAPFGLLMPLFAVTSCVLFLGNSLTPMLVVGGMTALAGVAVTQRKPTAHAG